MSGRHDVDMSEVMLAELHEVGEARVRRGPPAIRLVAPCPKCGAAIEVTEVADAGVNVKLMATGDGWQSYRVTIAARGSGTHVHNEP